MRKWIITKKIIISLIVIVAVVAMLFYLMLSAKHDENVIPGYVEANLSYISTSSGGRLVSLDVAKGQMVKKGQLLFQIDPESYRYEKKARTYAFEAAKAAYEDLLTGKRQPYIDEIEAQIVKAKADLAYARANYRRAASLIKSGSISQSDYDLDKSQYDQADAAVTSLEATLLTYKLAGRDKQIKQSEASMRSAEQSENLAAWQLSQTAISAPESGMVFDTYYWKGEEVSSYQPVLSLLIPSQVKLVFYVSEKQLSFIHLGQSIPFYVDGITHSFNAKIDYISPEAAYTPPVIYSESTRGDLSYKIEAKIDSQQGWHAGQPVSVDISGGQSDE
ncbi:MAG: HlyD family secretion protein [Francisellaceae bacterium]